MNGEKYLKIAGILLVLGGVVTAFMYGAIGLLLGVGASSIHDPIMSLGGPLVTLAFIALLLAGIYQIIVGILGIKYGSYYQKADLLFILGIILIVIDLISWLIYGSAGSFSISTILGMALNILIPAMYTYGAFLNKKDLS